MTSKKQKRLFWVIILIKCSLLVMTCSYVIAGSGLEEHSVDWNKTIGLNDKNKNKSIKKCWGEFQKAIDDGHAYPGIVKLKNNFQNNIRKLHGFEGFVVGYNKGTRCWHRVYFHWGFDAEQTKIKKTLSEYIREWDHIPDSAKDAFLQEVTEENARRNRKMIKAIKEAFGLPSTVSRKLAGIIYDVHILRDWQDSCTDGLASPHEIYKELKKKIPKKIKKDQAFKELLANLKKARTGNYKHEKVSQNRYGDACIAEQMLLVITEEFPKAFRKQYGDKLAKFDEVDSKNDLKNIFDNTVSFFK